MWPGAERQRSGQRGWILWALWAVIRGEPGAAMAGVKQEKKMSWFSLYQIPLASWGRVGVGVGVEGRGKTRRPPGRPLHVCRQGCWMPALSRQSQR